MKNVQVEQVMELTGKNMVESFNLMRSYGLKEQPGGGWSPIDADRVFWPDGTLRGQNKPVIRTKSCSANCSGQ